MELLDSLVIVVAVIVVAYAVFLTSHFDVPKKVDEIPQSLPKPDAIEVKKETPIQQVKQASRAPVFLSNPKQEEVPPPSIAIPEPTEPNISSILREDSARERKEKEYYPSLNMTRRELQSSLDYGFVHEGLRPIKSMGITIEGGRSFATLEDGVITDVEENSTKEADFDISMTNRELDICKSLTKNTDISSVVTCLSDIHTDQTDVYNGIITRACKANFGTTFLCAPFFR